MNLQKEITRAQNIVFMTGAGISTPSGIPDYRSKDGLYTKSGLKSPEYLLSRDNLRDHPEEFYEFVKQNMYFPAARPNIIHQKIAQITNEKGTIITQNVDQLHTKAVANNVIEFHGNLYEIYCQKCHKNVSYKDYLASMYHQEDQGVLRPAIVLYGESINNLVIENSIQAIQRADLIVVVGTSFRVYPFAGLLQYRQPETKVIAINKEDIEATSGIETIVADAKEIFGNLKE